MMKAAPRWAMGLVIALLMVSATSFAQSYPSKPIQLVLPYPAGALPDILARLVASKVSESIGQQMFVDNKAGASGIIGSQFVAKAAPDGYTVLLTANSVYAIAPALHSKLLYDPRGDFTAVTQAVRGPYFLVVSSSLGVNSIPELITLAKTRPGKSSINYGSLGNGTEFNLAMEQLKLIAKVELTHVPYKSMVAAVLAMVSGEISVMFNSPATVLPHVKAGKLRVLAVASPQRASLMPDVPTFTESGIPNFDVGIRMGFVVPAATPRAVVELLNREFVKALKSPDTESRMKVVGMEVVASSPEQFAEQIRKDQDHYATLVRLLGVKID